MGLLGLNDTMHISSVVSARDRLALRATVVTMFVCGED